ncbi:MAG: UTP--glucose-1-phosphate uridylyltransferase GalU [Acidobacteria bacterium]|nr:UTP--glucose-1-phosphate uridylyltransferase GalU [Acidobacteriota bacterium]
MKVRKAVFPAAGLGTRFLPATKAQPKEMLPIVDKPLIQYGVEEVVASGIKDIIIITGRGKNAIEDHFDISYELEETLKERGKEKMLSQVREISELAEIAYIRQKQALGVGHAVYLAKNLVGREPFAVLFADDIIYSEVPCTRQLVEVFEEVQGAVIAIQEVPEDEVEKYGIIAGKELSPGLYQVEDLVEKPPPSKAPSNLAIVGRYILTPEIFDELAHIEVDHTGELQLTTGLRLLLKKQRIYAYRFQGIRYDAGNKVGFLKATVEYALRRTDLGKEFREYLKSLDL